MTTLTGPGKIAFRIAPNRVNIPTLLCPFNMTPLTSFCLQQEGNMVSTNMYIPNIRMTAELNKTDTTHKIHSGCPFGFRRTDSGMSSKETNNAAVKNADLESRVSILEQEMRGIYQRVDKVEESTTLLKEESESLKDELKGEINRLKEQYARLSASDITTILKISAVAIVITFIIYYIVNIWHMLMST